MKKGVVFLTATLFLGTFLLFYGGILGMIPIYAQGSGGAPPRPTPPGGLPPNPYKTPGTNPGGGGGGGGSSSPDVSVTLEATPNIWVMRGATITYQVRTRNTGSAGAPHTDVYFPYHPDYLTVTTVNTEEKDDYVKSRGDGYLVLRFGRIRKDESRTITVTAEVSHQAPDGAVIWVQAEHDDHIDTNRNLTPLVPEEPVQDYRLTIQKPDVGKNSNSVPILVGTVNETCRLVWMSVEPVEGKEETIYTFFSDRFLPGERVTMWLNLASGEVISLDDIGAVANERGEIEVLLPGGYCVGTGVCQLVVRGNKSELQAVAAFHVFPGLER